MPPAEGFLAGLAEIAKREGALLIFDEVITGFRLSFGGAQKLYGVTPDLTTLGKIIGGGLPVAAYGGRREIMDRLAPLGDVYQAGTLSGNPLAMRAGIEMLKLVSVPGFYWQINARAGKLADGLRAMLAALHIEGQVQAVGSLMTLFFASQPITNYADAKKSDPAKYAAFFNAMLERLSGIPVSAIGNLRRRLFRRRIRIRILMRQFWPRMNPCGGRAPRRGNRDR